jgi:hypothetical protein
MFPTIGQSVLKKLILGQSVQKYYNLKQYFKNIS